MPGLKNWAPVPDPPVAWPGPPQPPVEPPPRHLSPGAKPSAAPPPWRDWAKAASAAKEEQPAEEDPLVAAVMATSAVPMGARK